jgi:hypothetical protein
VPPRHRGELRVCDGEMPEAVRREHGAARVDESRIATPQDEAAERIGESLAGDTDAFFLEPPGSAPIGGEEDVEACAIDDLSVMGTRRAGAQDDRVAARGVLVSPGPLNVRLGSILLKNTVSHDGEKSVAI